MHDIPGTVYILYPLVWWGGHLWVQDSISLPLALLSHR